MLIRKNDIFQIGPHFLGCGKAEDPKLVSRVVSGKSVSLILSDMPYAIEATESKTFLKQSAERKTIIKNKNWALHDGITNYVKWWV